VKSISVEDGAKEEITSLEKNDTDADDDTASLLDSDAYVLEAILDSDVNTDGSAEVTRLSNELRVKEGS
tara:strand:+ start:2479 stop:2685 length:207 start_codon:yes stop_codon:yes gene_type:complete